jgi:hypothetical protein
MAGLTSAQWQERLDLYVACEKAILQNQAYSIGNRSMTRADLAEVRAAISQCNDELVRQSRGGLRVRYLMPC